MHEDMLHVVHNYVLCIYLSLYVFAACVRGVASNNVSKVSVYTLDGKGGGGGKFGRRSVNFEQQQHQGSKIPILDLLNFPRA